METKMITIPFDVERAKKIQAGEELGKIVTRDGRNARVVCWDGRDDTHPIIALFWNEERSKGVCKTYMDNGCFFENGEECQHDLTLQVPEWTQFKDGDILACEIHNGPNDYCKWFTILREKIETMWDSIRFTGYVSYDYDFPGCETRLEYDDNVDFSGSVRFATDEEKQGFIVALKASTDPRAKQYLKRFFWIEEKQEQKFEFLQPVLVRDGKGDSWKYGEFTFGREGLFYINGGISWVSCIPYNDQTKHLLGTTDDWEEEECKR